MDLTDVGGKVWTGCHVTKDRDRWWAFVRTVMDLRVP
jgi:hypothetical protein